MKEMKKQQEQLKSLLETFVDFIRRKVVEDFRHVFGNFQGMAITEAETLIEGAKGKSSDLKTVNICSPSKSLSLWLIQITTNVLVRKSLLPFFASPLIIGSLGPSMKIIMDLLKQLTPNNINLGETVERELTPIIIRQVLTLLDEVIMKGLDADSKLGKHKLGGDQMLIQGLFVDTELFKIDLIKEMTNEQENQSSLPDAEQLAKQPTRYRVVYQDAHRSQFWMLVT